MNILFFGAAWAGSSALALKNGLSIIPDVHIAQINEDDYLIEGNSIWIRVMNRVLLPFYRVAMRKKIHKSVSAGKPDILLVYKGNYVDARTVRAVKESGVLTVNVFPDCSPHAHGVELAGAMGEYDLVISTKPFHPATWKSVYGYANQCLFVPHGYDPHVHYWSTPPDRQDIDIVMIATWREQYEKLLVELAEHLDTSAMRVVVGGIGWDKVRAKLPGHWEFPGGLVGRSYGEMVRRGRIVLAPVNTDVEIRGQIQPGDEDTTRTYELAAAHCFFLHRRTPYAQVVYSSSNEVPMWDGAGELAGLIRRYLPLPDERKRLADRAHQRAVPAYSTTARAKEVLALLQHALNERPGHA